MLEVKTEIDLKEDTYWISRNGHHYPFAIDPKRPIYQPYAVLMDDETFLNCKYDHWDEGYQKFKERQNG